MNKFEEFKEKSVAIITGGTAGHVIPATDLASYCKNATIYVNERGSQFCNYNNKIIFYLESKSIFNFSAQLIYFLWVLRKYEVVIGFGAFMCIPALIAATILRKEVYTHEQNSIVGQANQFLGFFGVKLLHSFGKVDNVGIPIKKYISHYPQEPIILVLAGSGCPEFFDNYVFDALSRWAESHKEYKVYFQTKDKSSPYVVTSGFFYNWRELMGKAQIVISRAGANTIAQLCLMKKQGILIPLSTAKQNHQLHNAVASGFPYIEEQHIEELIPTMEALLASKDVPDYQMSLFLID